MPDETNIWELNFQKNPQRPIVGFGFLKGRIDEKEGIVNGGRILEKNNLKIIEIFSFVGFFPLYMFFDFPEKFSKKHVWRRINGFDSRAHTWSLIIKKI